MVSLAPLAMAVPTDFEQQLRGEIQSRNVSQATLDRLTSIIKANPSDAEAHILLARCLDSINLRQSAHEEYEAARKANPTSMHKLLLEFKRTCKVGNPADGFTTWLELREMFPTDPAIKTYSEIVGSNFRTTDDAIDIYMSERAHGHGMPFVDTGFAKLRNEHNDPNDALRLANYELTTHRNDRGALLQKATAYLLLKSYKEAAIVGYHLYKMDPAYPGAARVLSEALTASGNYKEAVEPAMWDMLLSMSGSEQERQNAISRCARLYSITKASASTTIVEMKARFGNSAFGGDLACGLASMYELLGDNRKALAEAQEAASAVSAKTFYRLTAARIEEKLGLYDEAILHLENAYDPGKPLSPDVQAQLFRVRAKVHNKSNDLAWRLKDALRQR